MTFGEKLKMLRKANGMTQAQLAKKAGLSNGAIGNFESGKRTKVSFESVCKLADALGVEPEALGLRRRYDLEERMQTSMNRKIVSDDESDYRIDEIFQFYNQLNEDGKNEALKRISELCELSKYRG